MIFTIYSLKRLLDICVKSVVESLLETDTNHKSTNLLKTMKLTGNKWSGYQILDRSQLAHTKKCHLVAHWSVHPKRIFQYPDLAAGINDKINYMVFSNSSLQKSLCFNSITISSLLYLIKKRFELKIEEYDSSVEEKLEHFIRPEIHFCGIGWG